jgi:NAD(P)-dependent dehydrogenase (short-subunit alcohol dehydrogenase family)
LLLDHNSGLPASAEKLRAMGHRVTYRTVDVTCHSEVKKAIDELCSEGSVDGVIYLPRARVRKPWTLITPDEWHSDIDAGLSGAFFCVQSVFPYLLRSRGAPFVITISSVLAGLAGSESPGYHAAKAGLESLTRYLALELGAQGIRCNAVQVGWLIKDEHLDRFNSAENTAYRESAIAVHPLRRIGHSEDLVNAILFLGSERSRFITGQVIGLDGGITLQEHSHFLSRMTGATKA